MDIKSRINLYRDPSKRFGQVTNVIALDQFARNTNHINSGSTTKYLITQQQHSSSSQSSIKNVKGSFNYNQFNDELAYGRRQLPPLWVDIQEGIEDKISEAEQQFESLKNLRTKRFKVKFDDSENIKLDQQIDSLVTQLTNTIKASEKDLKQMMQEIQLTYSDKQIKKNIQQTYLCKLQDITRQLRTMEKEHLMRVKDLYGEEGEIIISQLEKRDKDLFADLEIIHDEKKRDMIQLEEFGQVSEERSDQIKKIVNQINDLAVIFKELSILVIEQGSVLDRIDFNIETANRNVILANDEFVKTIKRERSWRARGCMSCLITSIMVCLVLLALKHMG